MTPKEAAQLQQIIQSHGKKVAGFPVDDRLVFVKESVKDLLTEKGFQDIAGMLEGSIITTGPPELREAIFEFERLHDIRIFAINCTVKKFPYICYHLSGTFRDRPGEDRRS